MRTTLCIDYLLSTMMRWDTQCRPLRARKGDTECFRIHDRTASSLLGTCGWHFSRMSNRPSGSHCLQLAKTNEGEYCLDKPGPREHPSVHAPFYGMLHKSRAIMLYAYTHVNIYQYIFIDTMIFRTARRHDASCLVRHPPSKSVIELRVVYFGGSMG